MNASPTTAAPQGSLTSSPASTPALHARDLTRVYGRGAGAFTALHGVSLQVERGESLAIVGRSGSGKTTLMHLLALLDRPTGGSVQVGGVPAERLSAPQTAALRNREFGFVFQQFFLNPRVSVLENVVLPLQIAGVRASERHRRGMEALDRLHLADKARNRATDLSGGQKQRVAIARALVGSPSIVFADEPTGNLDSGTGGEVEQLLFDLQRDDGITLVVVTHDPDLAARCDRTVQVHDGVIEAAA